MIRVLPIALLAALWTDGAAARLPPPTPAEQAAHEEQQAQEEAQLEREKAKLERVQDEVAERHLRERANALPRDGEGRVADTNMPYRVRELPGSAGPHGGTEQSAEAHSAPAK
jgi:hypothetical protein